MTLNTQSVGLRYSGKPRLIAADESMFFALSVGDTNPAYLDRRWPGGLMAPPVYAAVYAHDPIREALKDPRVGVHYPSIVHYAQSFTWHRPVRPGDEITTDGLIAEVARYENGGVLTVDTASKNQNNETVTTGAWTFFDKSAKVENVGRSPRITEPTGTTVWHDTLAVPTYQSYVYAEASKDRNAIHTDFDAAKKRGLSGIIVHGFCTMACCHRVVVNRLCNRDPEQLSSFSLQFSKPVFPGDRLALEGFHLKENMFGIRVKNQQGRSVLRHVKGSLKS